MEEITKLLVNINVIAMEKSFYFTTDDDSLVPGELVIVETSRGIELGKVVSEPVERTVSSEDEFPHVVSRGTDDDLRIHELNIIKAQQTAKECQEEANKLELDMKVINAEYMLDGTKIIIYYLSDARVDFRDLLKVLAANLKCRIELRQIGTRDKAKMIGGIGICGLKLCCSTFLNEFDGISITMAKNQMLALNIPKLSGHCGKLICCLKYENETYSELQKDLPKLGLKVNYNDQIYKITSMNVITKMIRIENKENIQTVPYEDIKDRILPKDYVMPIPQITPKQESIDDSNEGKEEQKPNYNNQNNNNNRNNNRPFNKNKFHNNNYKKNFNRNQNNNVGDSNNEKN